MHWCHWQHCWDHMVPAVVPMVPLTRKVMLHFILNAVDLRNGMVPLMTPLPSHDTDANTNGITWPKRPCCTIEGAVGNIWHASASGITWPKSYFGPHFNHLALRITVVPLTTLKASHDGKAGFDGVMWTNNSCFMSFWSCLHKECKGTIHGAVHVTWY